VKFPFVIDRAADGPYRFEVGLPLKLSHLIRSRGDSEFCGFLMGHARSSITYCDDVFVAQNADTSKGRFAISQEDARRAERVALRSGLEVVAVIHSHPSGGLGLSESDREGVLRSDLAWVVVAPSESASSGSLLLVVYQARTASLLQTAGLNRPDPSDAEHEPQGPQRGREHWRARPGWPPISQIPVKRF
jgi:proteasome lid subunit RPN8/RPN11